MPVPILQPAIYAADVSPLQAEDLFSAAHRAVSAQRREKTDKYTFLKDKCLSLGAELLLRKALRDAGISFGELSFSAGEFGKPFLAGREEIAFNLSHSGHWVLCALSGTDTGCDIEEIQKADLKIAERFFTPAESLAIRSQEQEALQSRMFYRFWTAKESFLKATGFGLQLPLSEFEIDLSGDTPIVRQSADKREFYFREFTEIPGYCCTLCLAETTCPEALQITDIRACL